MISRNELGHFTKKISNLANLSRHCIRCSCIRLSAEGKWYERMSKDLVSRGIRAETVYSNKSAKSGMLTNKKISDCLSKDLSSTEIMRSSSSLLGRRNKLTGKEDLANTEKSQHGCEIININSQSSKEINCYNLSTNWTNQHRND